ncbi:CoA ester lyase [Actinosynnema sp. NPDC023587]|uniref:HpcH/HpaI aldolase/citrate lyase family protein n=1 Tax=Actinosynnema sp. NPDC023587 TaxID=3154695 RepID=UPI0033D4A11E
MRTDRYLSALTCGATVALVDLEDSVIPAKKEEGRRLARDFFTAPAASKTLRGVRINPLTTGFGLQDVVEISRWETRPQGILLPKADSPRDFDVLAEILDDENYTPELYALVESARAVEEVSAIAAHPRVAGVAFGAADYAITTGASVRSPSMLTVRLLIANAARRHGKIAIDSPCFALDGDEVLLDECATAKAVGFEGKGAIHTDHVKKINEAFAPTPEELDFARAIVDSDAREVGVLELNGRMIGPPFVEAAVRLVERFGKERA